MADSNKKFNFIHEEHRKIFEKLKSQAKENRNRLWTAEEISKYQEDWGNLIKSMGKNGLSWKELKKLLKVHDDCSENLKTVSNEKIAEISKAEENEIESAVSLLLKNPRSLDNSSFRGYEASAQQNKMTLSTFLNKSRKTFEKIKILLQN